MTNPLALSGQSFSLVHVLIASVPGGVITIAHDGREAVDAKGLRQRASRHLLRRLLCRKIASRYGTLNVGGAQAPPAVIYGRGLTRDGHALFPLGSDATIMVELF